MKAYLYKADKEGTGVRRHSDGHNKAEQVWDDLEYVTENLVSEKKRKNKTKDIMMDK